MNLSDGEKLILVMLSEIYKSQKIKGEIDPDLVLASVLGDKAWGLKWQYGGLFNTPEDNPPVVQETCNILDMYRLLTSSFERLSAADKNVLRRKPTSLRSTSVTEVLTETTTSTLVLSATS